MNIAKKMLLATSVFGLLACAQNTLKKQVEEEAARQPSRPFHGEVAQKGFDAIEASKDLTREQKLQLKDLETRVAVATFKNQDDMAKLKSLLFETLTTAPYQAEKVQAIKDKLVDLNQKKMETMFRALDDFEKIIGQAPNRAQVYRTFFMGKPL